VEVYPEAASMSSHSWEVPEGPDSGAMPPTVHDWEDPVALQSPPPTDGPSSDHESGNDSELDEEEPDAADEMIAYCIQLLMVRSLNAKEFCTIMHWAGLARVEKAKPLGLRPGSPSGHYQRKLSAVLGRDADVESMYSLDIPTHSRTSMSRVVRSLPVLVPHELVDRDASPALRTQLREAIDHDELPPAYFHHPVVVAHGSMDDPVLPLSIYLDGVPYSVNDSVIGIWIVNNISGGPLFGSGHPQKAHL
jgi:hypothetical protein